MAPIASALALVLALSSCAAETPVVLPVRPTATPEPSPTPSKTPSRANLPVPKAKRAAYVAGDALYVYDVGRDAVEQVARGAGIVHPAFLSENELSFVQQSGSTSFVRVLDLRSRDLREVFSVPTGIVVYAWSPDRQTVAYITTDQHAYPHLHFRSLVGAGSTRTVATLARALGRGGVPDDQELISFSPKGEHVLVVYTPADGDGVNEPDRAATQLQIRTIGGALAHGPKLSGDPTMGFWSRDGERAYYRYRGKARWWPVSGGRARAVPGGPRWFDPWPSPDGRSVAYDTGLFGGSVRVRTLDLTSGATRSVTPRGRARPVWASTGSIWVQAARACATCPAGAEVLPEVYAVRLSTGKERKLALPTLFDVAVWYA